MEGISALLNNTRANMDAVSERLKKDLGTLRTGRANPQMVENVRVEYYGVPTPLKQMAMINVTDARTLEIQPWDTTAMKEIEKAGTMSPQPNNNWKFTPEEWTRQAIDRDREILFGK